MVMESRIEKITPEIAERLLAETKVNRPARPGIVNTYAREMQNGLWVQTHQGIAISDKGTLLDGQHRLLAIVKSGVTLWMLVTRGVPESAQIAMDDHAKRRASDSISIARGQQVSRDWVAIIRSCVEIGSGRLSCKTLSTTELDKLYDHFVDAIGFVDCPHMQRGVTSASVRAALTLAWFYVDNLDRLGAFCGILYGREIAKWEGDRAAAACRDMLLQSGGKFGSQRTENFKKVQRAIKAFMDRQPISRLYSGSIIYPYPLSGHRRGMIPEI